MKAESDNPFQLGAGRDETDQGQGIKVIVYEPLLHEARSSARVTHDLTVSSARPTSSSPIAAAELQDVADKITPATCSASTCKTPDLCRSSAAVLKTSLRHNLMVMPAANTTSPA